MDHYDVLQSITSCRPGWYAFFEEQDENNKRMGSYWAEPIEAWGQYEVYYPDNEDLNGVEVYGMRVESTMGQLTNDFVDADNFIGVMFSKTLLELGGSDLITMREIEKDTLLLQRLRDTNNVRILPAGDQDDNLVVDVN